MKKIKKSIYGILVGGFFSVVLIVYSFFLLSSFHSKTNDDTLLPSSGFFTGKLFSTTPKVQTANLDQGESEKCLKMRTEIDALFEQSRICKEDGDCIVENKGMYCPFGCYQIHNKTIDIDEIMKQVVKFQEEKCFLCEYSCMTPPEQHDLKCQQNRCVDTRYAKSK